MEVFGIGPMELLLIVLLALIIFGPKDMEKAGRSIGRTLNKIMNSETWRAFTQVSKKMKNLPDTLMREARMEDLDEKKKHEVLTSELWMDDVHIRPPDAPAKDEPKPPQKPDDGEHA